MGYMIPDTVQKMPWTERFMVHSTSRIVTIPYFQGTESEALEGVLNEARAQDSFKILRSWRNELYPVVGLDRVVNMERAGSPLFGIHTFGVHMTAFCRSPESGLMIWVPRRAVSKTYGGMLDNSVAGGIAAGEDPFESIVREAAEEASLPAAIVKRHARSVGAISYFHVRDHRAGGEMGLLQPETQYVYDLEVEKSVVLKPSDLEVQEFYLWSLAEVLRVLREGRFKPNCALCLIDFLVRHGEISALNEPHYLEIVLRTHRRFSWSEKTLPQ